VSLVSLASNAFSRPILLTCDVIHDQSDERTRRMVMIDPDRRVIHDNAMTFTDGATSPLSSTLGGPVAMGAPGEAGAVQRVKVPPG